MKRWVDTWKRAGPELERIRFEEVKHANTMRAMITLSENFKLALKTHPPEPYSGLVEQQAWFRKIYS